MPFLRPFLRPSLRFAQHPDSQPSWRSSSARDLALWAGLVALGLGLTVLAVRVGARVGVASPPFTGRYRLKLDLGSLLAPVIAIGALLAINRGIGQRLPWRAVLLAGFLLAFSWAIALALVDGGNGLAQPLDLPRSYLHDVPMVGNDPIGFLRRYVSAAPTLSIDSRQHPPGAVLLLWALGRLGLHSPEVLGVLITAVGALSVPLVAVAVRSLCHEPAARALVPVLALAPYAVWLAVSLDAVTLTICAAAVACGVLGSEPRRSPWWAAAAGLLIGVGALFSYSVAWLGTSILVVYFVRRRPLLNVVSGAASLVPVGLARMAGFVGPDGLTAAQADFSLRVGPHRSWALWAMLDVLLVLIAAGPTIVPAARKIRLTPGWPFLVGAALAVLFAIVSGLSRGEVERSFLPFFPWLLVAAVAPEPGPAPRGAVASPVLLIAVGAATAVILQAVLRTAW